MSEEFSEKEKGPFVMKREPDLLLWQRIHELASGFEQEEAEAVALIFGNYPVVPQEADDLLKEMALPSSPVGVRRKVAAELTNKPRIPLELYLDLLQTLSKDEDQEIAEIIKPLLKPFEAIGKSFIALQESLRSSVDKLNATLSNLIPKNLFEGIIAKQLEVAIPKGIFKDIGQLNAISAHSISQLQNQMKRMAHFQLPQSCLDGLIDIKLANDDILRSISMVSTSYFPIERESVVVEPSENPLFLKLKSIPSGQRYWHQYQSMCKDILTFCFVPPLLDPREELRTEGGLHRRDILYPIPYGQRGFWGFLQNKFSASSIIVDAKKYESELPKDQVVITSKYFGAKKLGNFGLIISPKGPSKSAKKEQIDRWLHHDEMIICLSDANLEEMVALKEAGKQPELVLDRLIRELLQSV